MSNYTIQETFTLPSLGKIYPGNINPDITLRSMTTNDEMKRLNTSQDKPYKTLCDVIDGCILNNAPISSYDMCLGDYQYLLHKLRIVTYGSEYKLRTQCPYCKSLEDNVVNLDELEVRKYTDEIDKYIEFDLPISKKRIKIKHQTPRMLDIVTNAIAEDKKRTKQDRQLIITLSRLIDTVDGNTVDVVKLEDFIANLPMADTNTILRYSEKLTDMIGLDLGLDVDCEECGLTFHTMFRTTSEFFGPSIDI